MVPRYFILDENGQPRPAEALEWAMWFEGGVEKRRVAFTQAPGYDISTVFLGLDHSHTPGVGKPVLWETMVFPTGLLQEEACERYTSREDALAGHERLVQQFSQESK